MVTMITYYYIPANVRGGARVYFVFQLSVSFSVVAFSVCAPFISRYCDANEVRPTIYHLENKNQIILQSDQLWSITRGSSGVDNARHSIRELAAGQVALGRSSHSHTVIDCLTFNIMPTRSNDSHSVFQPFLDALNYISLPLHQRYTKFDCSARQRIAFFRFVCCRGPRTIVDAYRVCV